MWKEGRKEGTGTVRSAALTSVSGCSLVMVMDAAVGPRSEPAIGTRLPDQATSLEYLTGHGTKHPEFADGGWMGGRGGGRRRERALALAQ